MNENKTLEELKKEHFDWINNTTDIYVVDKDNLVIENDDKPIKLDLDNSYIKTLNKDCNLKLAKSLKPIKCHLNFKNSCQTHNCDIKIILPYKYLITMNNNTVDTNEFNKIIDIYKKDLPRILPSAYYKINNKKIEWTEKVKNELTNGITKENVSKDITKNNNIYMLNLHEFLFKKRQEGGATIKQKEKTVKIKKIKKFLQIFTQAFQSDLTDIIMKIMTNFEFMINEPIYNYYINDNEIICDFHYPKKNIKIWRFYENGDNITSKSDLHIYLYINLTKKSFPDYYLRIYFDDNEYKYLYRRNDLTFEEEEALDNNKVLFI